MLATPSGGNALNEKSSTKGIRRVRLHDKHEIFTIGRGFNRMSFIQLAKFAIFEIFMLAEADLRFWNTGSAQVYYESGVTSAFKRFNYMA